MSGPVLRLQGVGVAYHGTAVFDEVSLHVEEGQWLGLIGPNGAGKSSLLRAVAGLVPFTGTITFRDRTRGGEVSAAAISGRHRAQHVAMVPQSPVLPPGVTVSDYVLLGRTPHIPYLGMERRGDIAVVDAVLARLRLEPLASRPLGTLSGGERQRTIIARALAQEAPLLLLDEPTSALDVGSQQDVLELVAELCVRDGLTVVSAMHDLTVAGQFAGRLAMLSGHRLAACGPARQVLTEGRIREHYRANVRVLHDEDGSVIVVPTRRSP